MCSTNNTHHRVLSSRLKHFAPPLTALFAVLALVGCGKSKKAEPKPAKAATPVVAAAPAPNLPPCDRAHTELVDHDGKNGLDLVCHDTKGRHAVAIRKPDGSFLPTVGWWPSATAGWCDPQSLRSADYNGDHKMDMSCHSKDGKHLVAFANGDGTFSPGKWWPSPPGDGQGWCDPAHVRLGHYDNDSRMDISCHSTDGKHLVAFSNGDGSFKPMKWWPSALGAGEGWCPEPALLHVGKFNRGKSQLTDFICHTNDGKHSVALNNGDGTFSPKPWWPRAPGNGQGWCDPGHLRIGALTAGQSTLDLVCYGDEGKYTVAFNNGDGTFSPKAWWPSTPGAGEGWCTRPARLTLGSISGDKKSGNRMNFACHSTDGKHALAINNGDGTFTAKSWWPSELGAQGETWCDLGHLEADPSEAPTADLICRGDDGRILFATAQPDGKFVSGAWQQPQWPE